MKKTLLLLCWTLQSLASGPTHPTEVSHLVTPAEADPSAVESAIADQIRALTGGQPVPVDVICVVGGAMTAADCASARREIENTAGNAKLAFETVEAPKPLTEAKAARKSDWKGVFSFIRTVSAGTTVGLTVALTKGAGWPEALGVATIAAAWSGAMQYWNAPYLNWLAHQHWGATAAPEPHERASWATRWLKKMASTATYGMLLTAGFYATGLNHDVPAWNLFTRLGLMVADSLYNQTAWQALNQRWTQDAIQADPKHKYYYRRWSQFGSLVLSAANIATNALNIGGSHLGLLISMVVGTTGNVIAFETWRRQRKEAPCTTHLGAVAKPS